MVCTRFHGAIFFTGLAKGDFIAAAINAAGKRYHGDATTAAGTDESVRANITVYLQADERSDAGGLCPKYSVGDGLWRLERRRCLYLVQWRQSRLIAIDQRRYGSVCLG